jgi:amino acid permease
MDVRVCVCGVMYVWNETARHGTLINHKLSPPSPQPHQPFISNELPTKGFLGPLVRVLYSIAIMCSYPLQIFPGTLILEEYLIEPCGLPPPRRKLAKNCLRTAVVVLTCVTAIYAGKALDNFVALIGTIGSIPLGWIVPTLVHLWIFWKDTPGRTKALHALLATVGILSMVLSGSITISTW